MSCYKMVETTGPGNTAETAESGTTFGKLKQTLSSSLLTAQDKGLSRTPET